MIFECCKLSVNTELQRNYQKVACCAKKVDFQLQNKPQCNKNHRYCQLLPNKNLRLYFLFTLIYKAMNKGLFQENVIHRI